MPLHSLLLLILAVGADSPRVAAPIRFDEHAVVSENALASAAGARALAAGGNAVDAAIATAFALAVVHPAAGNIGGGGFLVVRRPDGTSTAIDFRETAPLAARRDLFVGPDGKANAERRHRSILSVGVPGTVAGLHLAHRRLGRLRWADLVSPAVELAAGGFPVSRGLADSLEEVLPSMARYPASVAQFSRGGRPLRAGELLVQGDLARSLERIRDRGPEGFYAGDTAALIEREMERQGGLVRGEDLARYRAIERAPVRGSYRGYEILSMPPPSSGGVALVQMLGILEGFDLRSLGPRGAREVHLLAESMRRAFADRARWLGDPDRSEVPVDRLTSSDHLDRLRSTIDPARASTSSPDRFEWGREGSETTHVSVLDGEGMAASLTTTLEESYGSRIVVPGAGFLLNNEMGDFNPVPGLTDRQGLIGTPPNLVEPGKRMLSSMTPTIVARDGRAFLVIGSPGGRTIINTVLEILVNVIDHGMPIADAIRAPRFHHQWLPDAIQAEPWCLSPDTRSALEAMGHRIVLLREPQGAAMGIAAWPAAGGRAAHLEAGVDPRRPDAGAAGR